MKNTQIPPPVKGGGRRLIISGLILNGRSRTDENETHILEQMSKGIERPLEQNLKGVLDRPSTNFEGSEKYFKKYWGMGLVFEYMVKKIISMKT